MREGWRWKNLISARHRISISICCSNSPPLKRNGSSCPAFLWDSGWIKSGCPSRSDLLSGRDFPSGPAKAMDIYLDGMKIIAKPLAGLANKLRVIESAVSLARDLNSPVEIVWVPDWQMVARYRELFEPSELFRVLDYDKFKYCRSSFSLSKYKKPFSALINRCYGIDVAFNETDISRQVRPGSWDIRALSEGKTT